MKRGIALIAVAVVLVGIAGIAAAGPVGTAVAQDDPVATNETGERNGAETANGTDISPGERLSGVIGVQRAEISGEVESRSFEVALNRTEAPEERAELVAERLNGTEERLVAIERRQRELRERRDAGELSQGAFAARMAETSARAATISAWRTGAPTSLAGSQKRRGRTADSTLTAQRGPSAGERGERPRGRGHRSRRRRQRRGRPTGVRATRAAGRRGRWRGPRSRRWTGCR
ncbi:hypothetical protein [Halorubrum saccharovorum]|uniref:hypothetical protein n=1 Tax=Halorubrum saccharovorum TaxID=2248 RepID=UPI001F1B8E65|nr:hypothetical protein [Halorubrum saccharovorum]